MEKRKWFGKKKSSDKSPSGSESSAESMSSPSEKESDAQEEFKASPSQSTQSPEVTSKPMVHVDDASEVVQSLTAKLLAALVNVSAKEELVKQHARVAEEAVAGWEKAENELAGVKEQLESAMKRNSSLEDRLNHLDGALKECVRQLRLAREEQEEQIQEAVAKKSQEWESTKLELENQIVELQTKLQDAPAPKTPAHLDLLEKLEFLEKENTALKLELQHQSEELEIRTIERDLSTQAAEMASKQNLESIKKVAKLEAECRKLRKCSSMNNDNRSAAAASSIYVESLTDSQSDSGERLNALDMDTCKSSGSEQWASALIAELNQFKNDKGASSIGRNLASSSVQIDLMDDFLEMERLAALPETRKIEESGSVLKERSEVESSLRAELHKMVNRTVELEQKLEKLEEEKAELKMALMKSQESGEAAQAQLIGALMKLENLQRELDMVNDTKHSIESQLKKMEAEAASMTSKVESLETEVKKEKALSVEMGAKCRKLEEELVKKQQELEAQQTLGEVNNQPKIKQEDLAVAAGRLAECQQTIVSLRKQLESLATLEDFLIDTRSIPDFSPGGQIVPQANGELWKLHSNGTYSPKREADTVKMGNENLGHSLMKNENGKTPPSSSSSASSSAASSTQVSSEKNRNGFAKFFSRTKNGIQLEI
ncbi:hypothetical protein CDL15_Pgr006465 [Punica granatum]|uniref:Filament-like plant protein n=1 Tax=Punica granatum TaxID=22663 RepID=A0A218XYV5_PUNGR|nr:hypothetical protein CDL15_Pgr006465 [Punica granatum]